MPTRWSIAKYRFNDHVTDERVGCVQRDGLLEPCVFVHAEYPFRGILLNKADGNDVWSVLASHVTTGCCLSHMQSRTVEGVKREGASRAMHSRSCSVAQVVCFAHRQRVGDQCIQMHNRRLVL